MENADLLFTKKDAWIGGNISLEILCPDRSLTNAKALFTALWKASYISGCFPVRDVEPEYQAVLPSNHIEVNTNYYGFLTLSENQRVCCYGQLTDYVHHKNGFWAKFWVPLGSLSEVYTTQAYPFGSEQDFQSNWLIEFADILKNIALEVNQKGPIDFAVIGNELIGVELYEKTKKGVPEERIDGYLIRGDEQLIWYPPTKYGPHASFGNANL